MNDNSKTIVALIAGLAAGAALGLLLAPSSGEDTVDKLSRSLADLKNSALDRAQEGLDRLLETGKEYAAKAVDNYASAKDELMESASALKEQAKQAAGDAVERA